MPLCLCASLCSLYIPVFPLSLYPCASFCSGRTKGVSGLLLPLSHCHGHPQSPGSPRQAHGSGATPTLLPGPWPWQYGAPSLQGCMVIGRGLFGALKLLPGKLLLVCGGKLPASYLPPDLQEPSRWGRLGARFCIWRAGQLCGLAADALVARQGVCCSSAPLGGLTD